MKPYHDQKNISDITISNKWNGLESTRVESNTIVMNGYSIWCLSKRECLIFVANDLIDTVQHFNSTDSLLKKKKKLLNDTTATNITVQVKGVQVTAGR